METREKGWSRRDDDEARARIGCARSTIRLSALPAILAAPNRLARRRATNLAALVFSDRAFRPRRRWGIYRGGY